ncbi:hypothetical protein Droror1_Dr00006506 [Drosera rotundifolia]
MASSWISLSPAPITCSYSSHSHYLPLMVPFTAVSGTRGKMMGFLPGCHRFGIVVNVAPQGRRGFSGGSPLDMPPAWEIPKGPRRARIYPKLRPRKPWRPRFPTDPRIEEEEGEGHVRSEYPEREEPFFLE